MSVSDADYTASADLAAPAGWPEAPHPDIYQGLAGAIVETVAPHTEADPVAILGQLLVAAGSVIGRGAFFEIEATRHHPNEFVVLVGDSAKARKGSSWDHVARLLNRVEPTFPLRTHSGLSTGEGLIWAVRDPAGADPGAADRRLLVVEPEFASVLKATSRDINTLSPVLRNAWDGRPLQTLTRTSPARASAAHISVIGHITATELSAQLNTVEIANGFLNRFVLLACRRVRLLPEGGAPDPLADSGLDHQLVQALGQAQRAGQVRFDLNARVAWWDTYPQLSQARPGLAGSMAARAEAHVLRLALIYALLDHQASIRPPHLHAALALWDYAARSAAWALGSSSGDPIAEQIHAALTASPAGLTRTQIRDLFARNQPAAALDQALATLAHAGRARRLRQATAGRPADIWKACHPDH
jgi:Protein of unknown function (DUF3987)